MSHEERMAAIVAAGKDHARRLRQAAKPRVQIGELAAKRGRCARAKAAGLPCTEFAPAPTTPQDAPATSDRVLVTINLGNVLHPESRASMQDAARRWGADYREITTPLHAGGGRPHWNKTFLHQWARTHGYKRVAYYDADILIRSDCPSLLDLVPAGHLGLVSNDQIDGVLWKAGSANRYHYSLAEWARRLGMRTPPLHEHANSGMIVFEPDAHGNVFDQWQASGQSCGWGAPTKLIDQAAFSVLCHNLLTDETRTWLPMQFNTLVYRHELIRSAGPMQTYVYHYTGHRKAKLHETQWRLHSTAPRLARHEPRPNQTRTPSQRLLAPDVDLSRIVERVAVINLDRRHDRWQAFQRGLPRDWPFPRPQAWRGIDVRRCPPPEWFNHDAGQWGCLRSHVRAIEDALNDGVESLLVLEDDAVFCDGFTGNVRNFFASVPDDWQMIFLGGCHTRGVRRAINDVVEIPGYVTLAHAYLLCGDALQYAYDYLCRHVPERPEVDHRLGAFAEETGCAVYAPRRWLVYQAAGFSDIRERARPQRGLVASDATAEVRHGV